MAQHSSLVLGGALGEDAHVAGVNRFLALAAECGWRTEYLGPAVPVPKFLEAIRAHDPELVAVSYRLTTETGAALLEQFIEAARAAGLLVGRRFAFGGTPPLAARAAELGVFERCFAGDEPPEAVTAFLRGQISTGKTEQDYPQTFVERLRWRAPQPLLRHHYGRPTVEETEAGIREVAAANVCDVISLGIDQDAQENFFHPDRQDPRAAGAGGVPVRSAADYERLYAASRTGNFPLLRVYSGTNDHLRLAAMYRDTIRNAWCATSLFWFGQLDRRGPLDVADSIRLHQELMRWHGARGVPVEGNEPHHWGMRDAPDVVSVAASFLTAYNAKKMGVRDYLAQYMFNCPGGLNDRMDLAKMLACLELNETLADDNFRVYRQVRTGLLSHPVDPDLARGHLGASVYLMMALRPHVVHVVGFSEAHHATTAAELVQSCRMAQRAVNNALNGAPDMAADAGVQWRKEQLVAEARLTLRAITSIAGSNVADPWTDPATLARAVRLGILDAPHLQGHPLACGRITTRVLGGACVAIEPDSGRVLTERERLHRLEVM